MTRLTIALSLITLAPVVQADELTPNQTKFFETKIRPVLIDSCYECHSKKAGHNKGGLTLDTKVGLRQGGNSGPGVIPKNLDESMIWLAVSRTEPDYKMPPKSKLPANVIADFRTWIQMGAPDSRNDGLPSVVTTEIDIEEGCKFWSFQKPTKTSPPAAFSREWSKTPIDRFVHTKLADKRMQPAARAETMTLVRRLFFDLIGLPPMFDQRAVKLKDELTGIEIDLASFSDDPSSYRSLVDQLLATQHFGERWGRHWLDIARYAESNGKESNHSYPNAWRYRDYVVDSFNNDKPYDRFVQEQIAGDLLPARTDEQWQEGLIATGFLAIGPKDLREMSFRKFTMDMVDEQIDTTTRAILGLTVACARCHDHKTDPVPTADYYSLAGIFLSSNTYYGTFGTGGRFNTGKLLEMPVLSKNREQLSPRDIADLKARIAELERRLREHAAQKREKMQQSADKASDTPAARSSAKRIRHEHNVLTAKLASLDGSGLSKQYLMGMQDKAAVADTNILVRGEVDSPAQVIPRGFLQVLNHGPQEIREGHSGRLELSRWLSSHDNPLTARVMVNRVWNKLFGRGLVSSTNNFGATGVRPTHPQLLDHLAVEFMEGGWSVKSLIRSIVLTRTYQASSQFNAANYAIDPDNEFLWRAASRRIDAEALRDKILATSGQLELTRPSGSRVAGAGDVELGRKSSPDLLADLPPHRSVYVPTIRNVSHELLGLFDGADPDVVTGTRDATNVANQALFMMNSPFILEQADVLTKQLMNQADSTRARVELAFQRAYGRAPTDSEIRTALQFQNRFVAAARETGDRKQAEWLFLTSVCQGLLSSAEFRFIN